MKRITKWISNQFDFIKTLPKIWLGRNQGTIRERKRTTRFYWLMRNVDKDAQYPPDGLIEMESYDRDPVTGELKGYVKEHYINGDYEYVEVKWR